MIIQFNEFINEGIFNSRNDKYIKNFFKEIKENFDYDNFEYYYRGIKKFTYNHDGIELTIFSDESHPGNFLFIQINDKTFECSKILYLQILRYFLSKAKKKIKIIKKEKELKDAEEIKNKLDPVNRKASEYNI